jgi:polyisoprenoid-binding protein YceI
MVIDRADPAATRIGDITVDVRQLKSDSDRRDRALRARYLESDRFPTVVLSAATLHSTPRRVEEGKPFRFTLSADLTVRDVTRRTTWQVQATLARDTLRGSAITGVKMSAFGIQPPSLLSLRSSDDVKLQLQFVAVPVEADSRGYSSSGRR